MLNKEHIQRVEAWNEFKRIFPKTCQEIGELKKQFDLRKVYHSSDFDDKKKSQLVLAFIKKPINVYVKESGELQVETQWGCRLIYELNYNGSVSSRVRDYEGAVYKLNTYPSASNISKRKIRNHVRKFLLIEKNTSKISQPDFLDKLEFGYFTLIQQKSWITVLKMVLLQVPIIKRIIKAISDGK